MAKSAFTDSLLPSLSGHQDCCQRLSQLIQWIESVLSLTEDTALLSVSLWKVILTILYWIAIVVVVFGLMYFHLQISSGYAYGIVYYYSIVDILLVSNPYISDVVFQVPATIATFAKLTPQLFGQLCLVEGLSGIDQQFIYYSHALAVSLIIIAGN